ncbi:MAG TPA: hypothetical protein VIU63_02795 [Nitrospira sp.]
MVGLLAPAMSETAWARRRSAAQLVPFWITSERKLRTVLAIASSDRIDEPCDPWQVARNSTILFDAIDIQVWWQFSPPNAAIASKKQ